MILRYLNRSHRPREIAPRRHPIPQLVEVVHLVGREIVDAHSVHARRSTVRSTFLPRLEHETASEFQTTSLLLLRSICRFLPRRVDLQTTVNCPALRSDPITGPSPLLRAGPPLCPHRYSRTRSVRCLWFSLSRPKTLAVSIGATGSPVPCQRLRRAHATYTPGTAGATYSSSPTEGPPRRAFVPGPPTDPSFDAIVVSFRCVSSGSHMFVFSSHTRPANSETSTAALTTRLLTDAACGGLESPPARRPRRTPPPSLAQHGRATIFYIIITSLQTHVGAGNSARGR